MLLQAAWRQPAAAHTRFPSRCRLAKLVTRASDQQTSTSSTPPSTTDTNAAAISPAAPQPLLSKDLQTNGYFALASSSCLFGAAAILFPEQLLQVAAGVSATPLDIAFARIAGSTMAISAAAEFSLQVGGHTKCMAATPHWLHPLCRGPRPAAW
jgi:hypothetical protein